MEPQRSCDSLPDPRFAAVARGYNNVVLGCAHEAADPEIIEDASVRWVKEDIREKLKAQEIEPTEFNVQSVIMGDSRLWERPLDRDFRDNMIASRNDDLDARVAILKENGNFKNVDTAMPVESLDDLEQYRSDRLTDGCDA